MNRKPQPQRTRWKQVFWWLFSLHSRLKPAKPDRKRYSELSGRSTTKVFSKISIVLLR